MIKINKKYLKKIIQEEAARISENQPWSEESVASEIDRAKELDSDDLLDFDKDDPQEWQDWDVIVSGLSGFIMDKLQDTIEDPRDLDYVERQIEVPLLDMVKGLEGDVIEHLVKGFGDDEDGDSAGRLGSEEDLMEEEDDSFSEAGEDIEKKGTKGVFTKKAKAAKMGVQAFAKKVLAKNSKYDTETKDQAKFAKGAATVARNRKKKK